VSEFDPSLSDGSYGEQAIGNPTQMQALGHCVSYAPVAVASAVAHPGDGAVRVGLPLGRLPPRAIARLAFFTGCVHTVSALRATCRSLSKLIKMDTAKVWVPIIGWQLRLLGDWQRDDRWLYKQWQLMDQFMYLMPDAARIRGTVAIVRSVLGTDLAFQLHQGVGLESVNDRLSVLAIEVLCAISRVGKANPGLGKVLLSGTNDPESLFGHLLRLSPATNHFQDRVHLLSPEALTRPTCLTYCHKIRCVAMKGIAALYGAVAPDRALMFFKEYYQRNGVSWMEANIAMQEMYLLCMKTHAEIPSDLRNQCQLQAVRLAVKAYDHSLHQSRSAQQAAESAWKLVVLAGKKPHQSVWDAVVAVCSQASASAQLAVDSIRALMELRPLRPVVQLHGCCLWYINCGEFSDNTVNAMRVQVIRFLRKVIQPVAPPIAFQNAFGYVKPVLQRPHYGNSSVLAELQTELTAIAASPGMSGRLGCSNGSVHTNGRRADIAPPTSVASSPLSSPSPAPLTSPSPDQQYSSSRARVEVDMSAKRQKIQGQQFFNVTDISAQRQSTQPTYTTTPSITVHVHQSPAETHSYVYSGSGSAPYHTTATMQPPPAPCMTPHVTQNQEPGSRDAVNRLTRRHHSVQQQLPRQSGELLSPGSQMFRCRWCNAKGTYQLIQDHSRRCKERMQQTRRNAQSSSGPWPTDHPSSTESMSDGTAFDSPMSSPRHTPADTTPTLFYTGEVSWQHSSVDSRVATNTSSYDFHSTGRSGSTDMQPRNRARHIGRSEHPSQPYIHRSSSCGSESLHPVRYASTSIEPPAQRSSRDPTRQHVSRSIQPTNIISYGSRDPVGSTHGDHGHSVVQLGGPKALMVNPSSVDPPPDLLNNADFGQEESVLYANTLRRDASTSHVSTGMVFTLPPTPDSGQRPVPAAATQTERSSSSSPQHAAQMLSPPARKPGPPAPDKPPPSLTHTRTTAQKTAHLPLNNTYRHPAPVPPTIPAHFAQPVQPNGESSSRKFPTPIPSDVDMGVASVSGDYAAEFENLNWLDHTHSDTDDAPKDVHCPWLGGTGSAAVGTAAGDTKEQGGGHGTNVTTDDLVSDQDLHLDDSFGWLEDEFGVEL
jgi:hypothetical protein